jgi:glycogen operon protein
VKLVAEPWDIGLGGYQVGAFPGGWSEWNDQFRRTLRRYWAGEGSLIGELGRRMTASADLFNHDSRSPRASVNHVTVHDGFTLADLVSYENKHNEANGEDNRDGSDDNNSTNCGVEGPTDDPAIIGMRRQLRRNFLASLLLAQGVPLILAGDEIGNSQGGNNNAYCQDNETGWIDWSGFGREGDDHTALVSKLTAIRRRFTQLRPRHWVDGRREDGSFGVLWLTPDAKEMTEQDWNFPEGRFLSFALGPLEHGQPALFVISNAAGEPIDFSFPEFGQPVRWTTLLDTALSIEDGAAFQSGSKATAPPRSVLVFTDAP